jgi:membrane protein
MASPIERGKAVLARLREKRPFLDHLIRAGGRYQADAGNQLAAAVTYFSFLSIFPLLLLALSVLGFVLKNNPDLQAKLLANVSSALPGGGTEVTRSISGAVSSRAATGIVGLLGLLYSGLSWVDNLRTAVRTVWHQNVNAGNFFVTKGKDVLILLGLGLTLGASVAITGIGAAATNLLIDLLGLSHFFGVGVLTKVITIALAVAADVLIFLWLFMRLPKVPAPRSRVLRGALFAAVGFEVLKLLGAFYIARVTKNATATYGTFGVVIGTLVWLNLVSRFVVFAAVWTVTAPYDDDVAPSGTADARMAERAGIPTEFAREDTADNRQEDGAPTPLTPALQDRPGVGFEPGSGGRRRRQPAGVDERATVAAGRPTARGRHRQHATRWPALAVAAGALLLRRRGRRGRRRGGDRA